ncbi:glycosyltransferase 87 family protein [Kitasatospora sp. NPDC088134]|uniref:glycosyltransferase 87 family protein n=1 Tax=Kitasatospora sp. NPDC088134 TaxID=3364071 RepID=UPI0037F51BFA
MTARPALLCSLSLAALAGCLALTFTTGGTLGDRTPLYGWYAADAALFALALLLLRRVPDRQVARLVLAGGVLVAAVGLLAPPRTSDDAYRYGWDGKVQAAGISPYAHPPEDPALARLRDPGRFPALPASPTGDGCTGWDERRTADGACTRINRPAVHTIYPPLAEVWFLLQRPFGDSVRVAQGAGAVLAVATTGTLLALTGGRRRAALWAWCPGVAVWAVNDAHVDTLGALLAVTGLGLAARRRPAAAGAALGAATAVKLLPALTLPGALSGLLARRPTRRDVLLCTAAAGVFALSYLPYLAASGTGVLGYLPGYLREEGYQQGHLERFGLLRLVLPDPVAPWAAAALLTALLWRVLRHGDPRQPWRGALTLTGTALLLAAPAYPWYALLVVALAALDGRWEWLAVPAAGQVLYLAGGSDVQQLAYGAAALTIAAVAVRRARPRRSTG